MAPRSCVPAVALLALMLGVGGPAASAQSDLGVRASGDRVELTWSEVGGPWQLESLAALEPAAAWRTNEVVTAGAGRFRAVVGPSGASRFFRLRQVPSARPARVVETSPHPGEAGVSVLRETVLRLDQPLDPGVILDRDSFWAEAAGRRRLTRPAISSDRRVLTLFYLEPQPPGARVRVTLRGDVLRDAQGRFMDGDADGLPGGDARLDFYTFGGAAVPSTAIVGRVFASEVISGTGTGGGSVNHPLAGVTITVDGAEQDLRTTTDADGNFRLEPCPAGRFFVHVDGHTAVESRWPGGAYYPVVGKAWDAVAGRTDNLASGTGEIFLPLIRAGTLQPVSPAKDTRVTFLAAVTAGNPALAGVELLVPANALVADDGTRGGRVGLAPVPPDRLPEPLPVGLELPLVITIQTDGPQNFDQPAPIRFPNLPDVRTGERLVAGAKSALWGFNHDTGRWELQGPMTVTADAQFVDCDPGVGVRQPGWFGTSPGNQNDPPPPIKNDRDKEKDKDCDEDELLTPIAIAGLLYQVADNMDIIAGSANYAGDHLKHFIGGSGQPIIDGPGSPRAIDLADSLAYANELNNTRNALESRIRQAVGNDPNANALGDFENGTVGLSFYGESGLPGGELQLGYTFGEVSPGDVDVNLSGISFETVEGGVQYRANLSFSVHERYEFNGNDRKQNEYLSFPGLAKCLQDSGFATPFDTQVTTTETIRGFIPNRPAPGPGPTPEPARITRHNLSPDAPNFARELPVSVTTAFRGGDLTLVLQPDGRYGFADNAPPAPRRCLYAVEDMATGEIIRRGVTGEGGTAFEGLILPSDRRFHLYLLEAATFELAEAVIATPSPGLTFALPPFILGSDTSPDADGDGVGALSERVAGTDATKADTDGDGIRDDAELRAGLPARGNQPVLTGVVAAASAGGRAQEIAVAGAKALIAINQPPAVAVFNLDAGLTPLLEATFPMPNPPLAVAADGTYGAAVQGNGNLVLIDLAHSTGSRSRVVSFPDHLFSAVAVAGDIVFLGTLSGNVVSVEAGSGVLLDVSPTGASGPTDAIMDLVVAGDVLYAISLNELHTLSIEAAVPFHLGSLPLSGVLGSGATRLRLARGEDFLVSTHAQGFSIFDLTTPRQPSLLAHQVTQQVGWKHALPNGAGLIIAAADPNGDPGDDHDVQVHTIADLTAAPVLQNILPTPGYAADLALANGLAYVADGDSGLQVMNYLPLDTQGTPPQVTLQVEPAALAAGRPARLLARARDDVQVARVEFWVNEQRVATDTTYPFEHRLVAPAVATGALRLRARAFDTGGNPAWSEEIRPAVTPPSSDLTVRAFLPPSDATAPNVRMVSVILDAPLDPVTIAEDALEVWAIGPDQLPATPDDVRVATGNIRLTPDRRRVLWVVPDHLPVGSYHARLGPTVRGSSGRPVVGTTSWNFTVSQTSVPVIVQTFPANGFNALEVAELRAVFSEPMARLARPPFTLMAPGPDGLIDSNDDVAVTDARVTQDLPPTELAMTFPAGFAPGPYRVRMDPLVTDLAGLPLAEPFSWTFRLGDDAILPQLVSVSPAAGSLLSDGVSVLIGTFSETLRGDTVTPSAVEVVERGADGFFGTNDDQPIVPAAVTYDSLARQVRVTLAAPLPPGSYRIEFTPVLRDQGNNPPGDFRGWIFSVATLSEVTGQVRRADGAPLAGAAVTVTAVEGAETTDAAGRFRVTGVRLPPGQPLEVRARLIEAGRELVALAAPLTPVHRGVTDAGVLVVSELCAPGYAEGLFPAIGLPGWVSALAVFDSGTGPHVYAALPTSVFSREAMVARWTGDGWEPVGGRFGGALGSGRISALGVFDDGTGPALYAGGWFNRVGEVAATNVARWNGTAWAPVGTGLTTHRNTVPDVRAFTVFDDGTGAALFAGGAFTRAGDVVANSVAKWNGTAWAGVGDGVAGNAFGGSEVNALAVFNDGTGAVLVAGGSFNQAGGQSAPGLARWNGTAWSGLGGGVTNLAAGQGIVYALHPRVENGRAVLHVGGRFVQAGSVAVNNVARWNGTLWNDVGGGVQSGQIGSAGSVFALGEFAGELIAAGDFGAAGEINSGGIARWNGLTWSQLDEPSEFNIGLGGAGHALATFDGELFVAGRFQNVSTIRGLIPGNNVARWNGTAWRPAGRGLSGPVHALVTTSRVAPAGLYVAGDFAWADNRPVSSIARWDGTRFHPLGGGLTLDAFGSPFVGSPKALLEFVEASGPALFAAGRFDFADGQPATNIARWNGTAWSPVGPGLVDGFGGGQVNALAAFDTAAGTLLVAGGRIESAGDVPTRGIAAWNGTAWQPIGAGLGGDVKALAVLSDGERVELIAAGNINRISPQDDFFGRIARWDGTRWRGLGTGLNGDILSLLVHNDGRGPVLYAGGGFDRRADGTPISPGIARWNGQSWESAGLGLGDGFGDVRSLTAFDDGTGPAVYAGGRFRQGNPAEFFGLARWDGTAWNGLDSGPAGDVNAVAIALEGGRPVLYFGGSFTAVGFGPTARESAYLGAWRRSEIPCPP